MSILKQIQERRALANPEQIDELSRKTLVSYVDKAQDEDRKSFLKGRTGPGKRHAGVHKALDKLGEEVEQPEVIEEGLKKVAEFKSESGKHTAKVYKDSEWGEHRVKFHINGKHHEGSDYHTDDVHDAHATAQHQLKALDKLHGALKEDVDAEYVAELSKATLNNYIHSASHDIMKRPAGDKNTKRAAGLSVAAAKYTKEGVKPLGAILDEAFDKGGRPKKKRDLQGNVASDA